LAERYSPVGDARMSCPFGQSVTMETVRGALSDL
jgi:hypothetical protein